MITAICIVSASELALINPTFTYEWADKNKESFDNLLFNLGIDLTQPIERQEEVLHKNRMNKVVQCDRWVGYERVDQEWLQSGHASREAKDKASNNKLLADLYRSRGHG